MPAEPPLSGLLSSPLLTPCPEACRLGSELGLITSWVPGGGLLLRPQEPQGQNYRWTDHLGHARREGVLGLLFMCLVVVISYHTALLFIPQ